MRYKSTTKNELLDVFCFFFNCCYFGSNGPLRQVFLSISGHLTQNFSSRSCVSVRYKSTTKNKLLDVFFFFFFFFFFLIVVLGLTAL